MSKSSTAEMMKQNGLIIFWSISFSSCSCLMLLGNKAVMKRYPHPLLVVMFQMLVSALGLFVFRYKSLHNGNVVDVVRWSVVPLLFAGMLATSMLALKIAPATLVVVIRSFAPILSLSMDYYLYGKKPTMELVGCLIIVLIGGILYAKETMELTLWAAIFLGSNMILAISDRHVQKRYLSDPEAKVDMSPESMVLWNNFLGIFPIMIVCGHLGGGAAFVKDIPNLRTDLLSVSLLIATSIVGLIFGYVTLGLQSCTSATTTLVLTNANKIIVVLFEWQFMAHHMTNTGLTAAMILIFGSLAYAYEAMMIQQKANAAKDAEKDKQENASLLGEEKEKATA